MSHSPLQDMVALVTGGGSGLGRATCEVLSEAGVIVVAGDVREESARETARSLQSCGTKAHGVAMDVSDEDGVAACIDNVVQQFGRLDILINNAGTDVTLPVDELRVEDWDRVLAVNLRGPFLASRAAVGHMKARGGGHIVNIVSTAAKRAWPNAAAYHASKWGLLGFSHALHTEMKPFGVSVSAVVVGGMRTPFLLDRFPDIDVDTLQEPRSVAETVRFVLCQPKGTVIPEVMVLPVKETSWP